MNALVLSPNVELRKHDDPLCVTGAVRNPIFLGQGRWSVHDELISILVVGGCCLHLDGVVAVPELSEAKAANVCHVVDALKEVVVPLGAEAQHGTTKQVELHCHLGAHGRVDHCQLVRREDPQGVVVEVQYGDEALPADPGQPLQRHLPLLLQGHIVPRLEERVGEQLPELVPHVVVVMVEQVTHGGHVEGRLWP